MTDFDPVVLPAFAEWRAGFQPPPDALAYLAEHLSVTSASLMAKLFAPDLFLVRGCVIFKDRYSPENFELWWAREVGNTVAVERALNHLHLWDIFEPEGEAEEKALEAIAVQLSRAWESHAAGSFPDRQFQTEVTHEYGPTIVMSSAPRVSAATAEPTGD